MIGDFSKPVPPCKVSVRAHAHSAPSENNHPSLYWNGKVVDNGTAATAEMPIRLQLTWPDRNCSKLARQCPLCHRAQNILGKPRTDIHPDACAVSRKSKTVAPGQLAWLASACARSGAACAPNSTPRRVAVRQIT